MSLSDPLFNPEFNSWATEYFISHGDVAHTLMHIANDEDIPEDVFEDLADSFTTLALHLDEIKPWFDRVKYFDREIHVVPSIHDNESVRFEIHETLSSERNSII